MANVEHSTLTGTDLHEPKGVSGATDDHVAKASSGAVSWGTVGLASLADVAKAFQGQLLHVYDNKAGATDGGTFTSGDQRVRDLNTVGTNEITSASLGSNQITLPAGTYFTIIRTPAFAVAGHANRLWNVTDGSVIARGSGAYSHVTSPSSSDSWLITRFTLGDTKVLEVRHRCASTKTTNGFGAAHNLDANETYTQALFWKTA